MRAGAARRYGRNRLGPSREPDRNGLVHGSERTGSDLTSPSSSWAQPLPSRFPSFYQPFHEPFDQPFGQSLLLPRGRLRRVLDQGCA